MSKALVGRRADVEVGSLDIGHQVEAERAPIYGITYDRKSDLVEVALEQVDHLIARPVQINVDYSLGRVAAIEVIDADNVKQIIRLKDPLALPTPQQQSGASPEES